jgi:hypothetical protein
VAGLSRSQFVSPSLLLFGVRSYLAMEESWILLYRIYVVIFSVLRTICLLLLLYSSCWVANMLFFVTGSIVLLRCGLVCNLMFYVFCNASSVRPLRLSGHPDNRNWTHIAAITLWHAKAVTLQSQENFSFKNNQELYLVKFTQCHTSCENSLYVLSLDTVNIIGTYLD